MAKSRTLGYFWLSKWHFIKFPQFAKNPLKSYMRQWEAFRADIFFKFDLENDLLTMNLAYNHFENKFNHLRHLETPTVGTKMVKIGPWTPKIYHFRFTVGGHLGFGRKRGLKGSKIWTLWYSCYLIPNDAISTPYSIWTNKSRQITSQPLLYL